MMIIQEVAPTLTCVATPDGFQFELLLRAEDDKPAITRIRIGPYRFKPEHRPRAGVFGLSSGGPENAFWMHKTTPTGWSRWHWETVDTEPDHPTYLVTSGVLPPGKKGLFKITSLYAPGGLRAGLELYRGDDHTDYGVTGPNYEQFLEGDHGH
ncbi:MAG: hypothetical protein ACLQVD_04345 [Capsulimonadaceae bacterium]